MRLIDADELLEHIEDYGEGQYRLDLIDPYYVRNAPTVDAIPKSVLEDIKAEIEAKIKRIDNEDTVNGLLGAWTIVDNYLRGEDQNEDT